MLRIGTNQYLICIIYILNSKCHEQVNLYQQHKIFFINVQNCIRIILVHELATMRRISHKLGHKQSFTLPVVRRIFEY